MKSLAFFLIMMMPTIAMAQNSGEWTVKPNAKIVCKLGEHSVTHCADVASAIVFLSKNPDVPWVEVNGMCIDQHQEVLMKACQDPSS